MMKLRISYIILLLGVFLCGLSGCVREDFIEGNGLADGEGWLYVPFNAATDVDVSTKATLDYSYENTIRNIYVFIFDASGNKIYGSWLTDANLKSGETEVRNADEDCWWISNSATDGVLTTGGLKVKASAGEGFKVYIITNLDADMVKVSSDLLAHNVSNEQDLKDFKVYMNVESVNRNGQFPMTGMISDVKITAGSMTDMNDAASKVLKLVRLDAKIRFVFKTGERADPNKQTAMSFTAKQWRIINVPATSYAVPRDDDACEVLPGNPDYQTNAPYFFDTAWRNFEDFQKDGDTQLSGFSFYMLENRLTPKNNEFESYNERSRQIKDGNGLNTKVSVEYVNSLGKTIQKDFRQFVNANDFSTYVLVTGRVDMKLLNDDAGQTLGADVQYMIHLGNWNLDTMGADSWQNDQYSNVADYNTQRNHSYTYTVTVNSVNNIRVEVESSRDDNPGDYEYQPGATGEVVIAKEDIALCDAHYESKTMTFHASNFIQIEEDGSYVSIADRLTWKVKTPFGEGSPIIEDGVDVADHLDYKWATFRLNKQSEGGSYYSDKRRKFTQRVFESKEVIQDNPEDDGSGNGLSGRHNDGCMDIIALVKYIKTQAQLYVDYMNALRTDPSAVNKSDFDSGSDEDGDGVIEFEEGPKICMTVFVNEFYYDEHPITHQADPTLWKRFVNQPDRSMHILCDSNSSTDLESTATGSVITIQQKAIKTIYNTELDYTVLETAWGTESVQEYADEVKMYNISDSDHSDSGKNIDPENGRANSIFEWGLAPDDVNVNTITDIKADQLWGTYLDFEVENNMPQLNDEHKALRYSCMVRNRDNNGDGKITKDEIRWYTASIRQLNGLFVGNGLLDPSSRLYNRSIDEQLNDSDLASWTQLIISSSHYSEKTGPTVLWAHEGLSTSSYGEVRSWNEWKVLKTFGVRCVRNLGTDKDAPLKETPQNFIEHEEKKDSEGREYHVFTCTHLNFASLRDYNSGELTYGDERSPQNQLYKKFETSPTTKTFTAVNFHDFNQKIEDNNKSSVLAGYCPEGYRVPSQIEMTMMKLYDADVPTGGSNNHTRTYWSFGPLSNNPAATLKKYKKNDGTFKYGFTLSYIGNMTVEGDNATSVRCVRDIRVD